MTQVNHLNFALPTPAVCLPKKVGPRVDLVDSERRAVFRPVHDKTMLVGGEETGGEMRQDEVEELVRDGEDGRFRSRRIGRGSDRSGKGLKGRAERRSRREGKRG
jgi:hypothetical protein